MQTNIAVVIYRSASRLGAHNIFSTAALPAPTPPALRVPAELLTSIFEQLPARDAAAATRVCRFWALIGIAVLWRSPPEHVLRQLSTGARRVYGAAFVAELRLRSRSVGRILAEPWPRLTSLCVSLTVILAHQQLFCRFVREQGGDVFSLPESSSGGVAHDGSRNIMNPVASFSHEATVATASTRLLTSVRIGKQTRQSHHMLPTDVLVVLARCLALRRLFVDVCVPMQAVLEAVNGSGANDVVVPTIGPSLTPFDSARIFNQLRHLTILIGAKAAVLLLQHLRATAVSDLRLDLTYREVQDSRCTGELFRVLARFAKLRYLTLMMPRLSSDEHLPRAADIRTLRALRYLRELRLGKPYVTYPELTEDVLLGLLECMPEIRVLSLEVCCELSGAVVPAIGALCPMLEQLKLPAQLDNNSFANYATKVPTLPNLTSLALGGHDYTVDISA